jgi:hypothetical protein
LIKRFGHTSSEYLNDASHQEEVAVFKLVLLLIVCECSYFEEILELSVHRPVLRCFENLFTVRYPVIVGIYPLIKYGVQEFALNLIPQFKLLYLCCLKVFSHYPKALKRLFKLGYPVVLICNEPLIYEPFLSLYCFPHSQGKCFPSGKSHGHVKAFR